MHFHNSSQLCNVQRGRTCERRVVIYLLVLVWSVIRLNFKSPSLHIKTHFAGKHTNNDHHHPYPSKKIPIISLFFSSLSLSDRFLCSFLSSNAKPNSIQLVIISNSIAFLLLSFFFFRFSPHNPNFLLFSFLIGY